jgi:hypothetical protein
MTLDRLAVVGFPGLIYLIEAASPSAARTAARSLETPPGWFASRAYRSHFGVVGMGPARVGVDIEVFDPTVTADAVLTRREQGLESGSGDLCRWWSAKEALAKALGDARRYDPRHLESPALWSQGREGRWIAGELCVPAGFVGWVVWEADAVPIDTEALVSGSSGRT